MVQFAEVFPNAEIVAALLRQLRQLGWTHFTLPIPIKEPLKRDFYAEMYCIEEAARSRLVSTGLNADIPAPKPPASSQRTRGRKAR